MIDTKVDSLRVRHSEGVQLYSEGRFAEAAWFEPDFGELVRTLRQVYEHREEPTQRGRAAAKCVREEFAWSRITPRYADRIRALLA